MNVKIAREMRAVAQENLFNAKAELLVLNDEALAPYQKLKQAEKEFEPYREKLEKATAQIEHLTACFTTALNEVAKAEHAAKKEKEEKLKPARHQR